MSSRGSLAEFRTTVRVGGRTARRAAAGAMAIGPRAFVHAVLDERRSTGRTSNASSTWVDATEGRTTTVWIHEYWTDTYGIDAPIINLSLVDGTGAVAAAWTLALAARSTHGVDVRAECLARGVPLPFTGQLRAELRADELVAGRPLQVLAEYRDADGSATLVHGQYGPSARPLAQEIGALRVAPDAVAQHLSIPNGLTSARVTKIQPRVTLRAHDGRTRRYRLAPIPTGASSLVDLHQLVPDLAAFLDGQAGQVSVRMPYPATRLASCTVFADGRRIVNHGTIDRVFDQSRGVPASWTSSWPVVSLPLHVSPDTDTVITVPNRLGPVLGAQRIDLRLFDRTGHRIGDVSYAVRSDATLEIHGRDILQRLDLPESYDGHLELAAHLIDDQAEQPSTIDVVVAFEHRGARTGEALAGGAFFNAPVPGRLTVADVRRTRVFGLVRCGAGERTQLFLANPAGRHAYNVTAHPTVTLLDADGATVAETTIDLAPHAGRWFSIDTLFPDAAALLGPTGVGTVRLRDVDARVYGYFLVDNDTRTVMFDHLVGG